jgi:hypothetical protein
MGVNTELSATNGCDGRRSTDGTDAFEETQYLSQPRIRLSSTYGVTTVTGPPPFFNPNYALNTGKVHY